MEWEDYKKLKPTEQKEYEYRFNRKKSHLGFFITFVLILSFQTAFFAFIIKEKEAALLLAILILITFILATIEMATIEASQQEWLRQRGIK